ncbi:ABC transporter permease [Rhodoferax sp. U2-2l]|uniref:ABC transporter permease n=1 Tax=Rhodoferax sp. U2-2l TaxID=2884000 RepID=UPI001D09B6E5|nr:ABC transporter permease [Rhodoferax sp. U2-2l]MCB8747853.1 ABC transporter permease [Rhodoferax sp. U2-2l]
MSDLTKLNAEGTPTTGNAERFGRPSLLITLSVWRALFLREALARLFSGRATWFWLVAEPVFSVAIMLFVFTVIRVRTVGGIDTMLWLMVGMLGFFMFRRTGTQAQNAISANRTLFTYRQVLPVDTALVRAALEALLMVAVAGVLLIGAALLGHSVVPANPLAVLEAFLGLWLAGLGFGLVTSVVIELVPELGKVLKLVMAPLMILSGVMIPISAVPQPYQGWLMLNPVAHGLEAARLGFAPYYHAVPELSMAYLYAFALVFIFFGLALYRRFATKLVTQ